MPDKSDIEKLYAALDAGPADALLLLALADGLEEAGGAGPAQAVRWAARAGKFPYRYRRGAPLRYHHEDWHEGWSWWTTDREPDGWGYPAACQLPHALWRHLTHGFHYDPTTFKEYATTGAAYAALAAAWERMVAAGEGVEG